MIKYILKQNKNKKSSAFGKYYAYPVVEETIVFILLQLFVIAVYFIRPLTAKTSRLIYWCVSEALVIATVWFWGIFIVGPIWLL